MGGIEFCYSGIHEATRHGDVDDVSQMHLQVARHAQTWFGPRALCGAARYVKFCGQAPASWCADAG
jgi:hypothetical protein